MNQNIQTSLFGIVGGLLSGVGTKMQIASLSEQAEDREKNEVEREQEEGEEEYEREALAINSRQREIIKFCLMNPAGTFCHDHGLVGNPKGTPLTVDCCRTAQVLLPHRTGKADINTLEAKGYIERLAERPHSTYFRLLPDALEYLKILQSGDIDQGMEYPFP